MNKEAISYMMRFTKWAFKQKIKTEEDGSAVRAMCKYLSAEAWQKDFIDSFIDGRLSLMEGDNK